MAQVGIYAQSMLGVHTHASAGQGGQLDPETALNPQPVVDFGDGSDGDVTIAVGTVVTRDMSYNSLVINNGGGLFSRGFKIRVKKKLTINVGGDIFAGGEGGGAGVAGVGGVGGGVYFTASRIPKACLPTPGAAGGNGGGAGVGFSVSNIPGNPVLIGAQLLYEGRLWAGAGGAGGGAIGVAPADGGIPSIVLAGAKGGRGADAIYVGPGNRDFGGGGGGAGGGLIEIWCNELDNQGNIAAPGGPGGTGEGHVNAQAGGGGGGGGGAILIFYKILSGGGIGASNVNGGGGGGSFGGAADGSPGTAGFFYAMKIGV